MTESHDVLVADYLSQVSTATAGLPPAQRDELLRDLREHIESGRADLPEETEVQVREILERLGDPIVIARAAAEDAGPMPPAAPMPPAGAMPEAAPGLFRRRPIAVIVTIAVIVALFAACAGVLFFAQSSSSSGPSSIGGSGPATEGSGPATIGPSPAR
jgi:uncharacterized membrane protein